MSTVVTYQLEDSIATITMDDGKVNALSLRDARRAQRGARPRRGGSRGRRAHRPGGRLLRRVRSAGARAGGADAAAMVLAASSWRSASCRSRRRSSIACTGHAIAMGVFLLLSGDYRIGAAGSYKIAANEVAIGITMPLAAVEILRQRLAPAHFNRAVMIAETFSPDDAVAAGFLDRVVPAAELQDVARAHRRRSSSTLDLTRTRRASCARDEQALSAIGGATRHRCADDRRTFERDRRDRCGARRGRRADAAVPIDPRVPRAKQRTPELRDRVLQVAVAMLAERGRRGIHDAQGRRGGGHVDAGRLRALRRQGRARPRDVLRGLPPAAAALRPARREPTIRAPTWCA